MTTEARAGGLAGLPDSALLPLVRGRSDAAFAALDGRYRPRMTRHCLGIVRDPHDAEEAVQNAMLSAYRSLLDGTSPASVGAWLTTICTNECYDVIRRRTPTAELSAEIVAREETAYDRVERKERIASLRQDLADLPEAQRRALVLRGFADLPHAQIARVLGGTPQEMRTLVHEARATLKEFDAGRCLDCAVVRERIDTGDGRALRARRIRAHLRQCPGCRDAAAVLAGAGSRSRLRSLLPFPALASVLRSLFAGAPSGVVGAAGVSTAMIASAVIVVGGGPGVTSQRPAPAAAAQTSTPSASALAADSEGSSTRATRAGVSSSGTNPSVAKPLVRASADGPDGSPTLSPLTASPDTTPSLSSEPARARAGVTQLPPVSVRAVTTPPVSVPALPVPSVSVPSVETPSLPGVGSISTPPISTPAIPLPGLAAPEVAVPPVTSPPTVP